MGRREVPIDPSTTLPELRALAERLRSWRHAANLTYSQLAERTPCSSANLKRAASGKHLPSYSVASSYTAACRAQCSAEDQAASQSVLAELHAAAKRAVEEQQRAARRSTVVPKPQLVHDLADLSRALREQWAYAGRPSIRQMAAQSRRQLSRSTANRIANGHTVPRDMRQFVAFLQACHLSSSALAPWFKAWVKVHGAPTPDEYRLVWQWLDANLKQFYLDGLRETVQAKQWRALRIETSTEEMITENQMRIKKAQQDCEALLAWLKRLSRTWARPFVVDPCAGSFAGELVPVFYGKHWVGTPPWSPVVPVA
ncbi:helix-turn-helix domain-containing protein [Streptomyces rishiriensis]|uniref:helix-turn-helix domain-containing protein n=1 Tax=Streptomyces rishiriensis TaxID=68264 RepID=UPI000D5A1523|nr:helix-turn-helix transcriptional regulator [Streptomyces rishiriensis]